MRYRVAFSIWSDVEYDICNVFCTSWYACPLNLSRKASLPHPVFEISKISIDTCFLISNSRFRIDICRGREHIWDIRRRCLLTIASIINVRDISHSSRSCSRIFLSRCNTAVQSLIAPGMYICSRRIFSWVISTSVSCSTIIASAASIGPPAACLHSAMPCTRSVKSLRLSDMCATRAAAYIHRRRCVL